MQRLTLIFFFLAIPLFSQDGTVKDEFIQSLKSSHGNEISECGVCRKPPPPPNVPPTSNAPSHPATRAPLGNTRAFNATSSQQSRETTTRSGERSEGEKPKLPMPPLQGKPIEPCPPLPPASECEKKIEHDGCGLSKDSLQTNKEALAGCEGYTVNFDDVSVVQLIKFISQIAEINFVYERKDVENIKITIVSDEPTSVKSLMTSLVQVLRMNSLSVVEEGKNVVIFKEQSLARVATIVTDENACDMRNLPVVTRVFRLYNLSPDKVAAIIKPLLSKDAIVEQSPETRHLVVSDLTANVDKIADLLVALDTPNAAMDIAEYEVKSAYPAVLVTYAKEILAPLAQTNPVQFIAQPAAHKIFIISTPYLINKAMQVLASLDLPEIVEAAEGISPSHVAGNKFHVYKLKYRSGKDIAQAVRDIGTNLRFMGSANIDMVSAISSIQWIETNNSLVISGSQDAVDKVINLINDLDVAPKQVFIEVLIIDTTISESLNFGVEWIALGNEQNKLAFASGLLDAPPSGAPVGRLTGTPQPPLYGGARAAHSSPPPNASRSGSPGTGGDIPLTSGFGFGVIGNVIRHHGINFLTLGGLVKALETDGDTTIVLNPRIMAQDTYEANFFVGQNIPYQTTSTIVRDTGSVTQNLQYEDIGVQLRVVPHIGPNNVVTLDIDQAVSDVQSATASIDSVGQGPTLLLAPTTTKTLATTRLHVPDGCFLVMSGHIRDQIVRTHTGIPCLGTLPLVGPAFSSTNETRVKRNLIMFLRPHVIVDVEDGVTLTNREGYNFNWESHPSSIDICPPARAPEFESCTNPPDVVEKGKVSSPN